MAIRRPRVDLSLAAHWSSEDQARRIDDRIQPNPLLMSNLERIYEFLLKRVAYCMRMSVIPLAPVYAE